MLDLTTGGRGRVVWTLTATEVCVRTFTKCVSVWGLVLSQSSIKFKFSLCHRLRSEYATDQLFSTWLAVHILCRPLFMFQSVLWWQKITSARTRTRTNTHTRTDGHTHTDTRTYAWIHTRTYTRTHIHTQTKSLCIVYWLDLSWNKCKVFSIKKFKFSLSHMHVLINHPPVFTYLYHAMMQANSLVLGFVHARPEKSVILQ